MAKQMVTYAHVASLSYPTSNFILFPPVPDDPSRPSPHFIPWILALEFFHTCENHSPELCCYSWPVTCTDDEAIAPALT